MITKTTMMLRIALALVICTSGLRHTGNAQSPPSQLEIEQNKALVRRWIEEGFNKKEPKVADEIFVESISINGVMVSRENLKQNMRRRFTAFPDLIVRIEEILGEGDKVVIWYTAQGTHKGEFEGFTPTGRHVKWFGVDLVRIESGKIVQARFIDDSMGLMRQLGGTLSPPLTKK